MNVAQVAFPAAVASPALVADVTISSAGYIQLRAAQHPALPVTAMA